MTEWQNRTRRMKAASWVALLSLTACSPYQFAKEIGGLNAGVDHIAAAFDGGYANFAIDRAAARERQMIDARAKVAVAASCNFYAAEDPRPCALFPRGSDAPT